MARSELHDLEGLARDIRTLIRAGVDEDLQAQALEVLEDHLADRPALEVLHLFYSNAAGADEMVTSLRLAARAQGLFIIAALTPGGGTLFLLSCEGVERVGPLEMGLRDAVLLSHFGFADADAFCQACARPTDLPLYQSLEHDQDTCPACWAATGELHEFGCPVEVCPWCGGQLVRCSCRFDRLGLEFIESEEQLDRFLSMLEDKGRIPYAPEQRPGYLHDPDEV